MSARAYLGRRKLTAAALALIAALAGSTAGASRAPAAVAVTAGCGATATGSNFGIVSTWRFSGCSYVAYAWTEVQIARSDDGWATAKFQTDGNLVIYNGGVPVWASNTSSINGSVYFGYDGNLSVKATPSSSSATLWSSGNYFGAYGPMHLVMYTGGNLVLYNGNWKPYWSSFNGTYYS